MWQGDSLFLLRQLILKDFRIRYRTMSLGVLWSLLNPLVMVSLLTFVFTVIFGNKTPHFSVVVLTGLLPYQFFAIAWMASTESLVQNAGLIKRVPVERALIPIAAIFSNLIHLGIQFLLLIAFIVYQQIPITLYWFWLPLLWLLEILVLVGLGLASSAANVFIRDTKYVVESSNLILFWLVPISYTFDMIPPRYVELYQFNPVAALVLASRVVLIEGHSPPLALVLKLGLVAAAMLTVGGTTFHFCRKRFYAYL